MTDTAALFDEIMQWSSITAKRQPDDFTPAEFALHIGRSETSAKRALQEQVRAGRLGTEKRFDQKLRRNCRVYWVIEERTGGVPIDSAAATVGDGG